MPPQARERFERLVLVCSIFKIYNSTPFDNIPENQNIFYFFAHIAHFARADSKQQQVGGATFSSLPLTSGNKLNH